MNYSVQVKQIFNCNLERAYKTPMLGDATKTIGAKSWAMPQITHFSEDETWGREGGTRIPHSEKNFISKGGPVGIDTIIKRDENKYWKWQVTDFMQPSFGFVKFQGQLFFKEKETNSIEVNWIYTLFTNDKFVNPLHWYIANIIWKGQMKRAIAVMKKQAEGKEEYLYS